MLVATILSAQCTDERVNQVTEGLFARYPDAPALAAADEAELEDLVRPTGFYHNKARSLRRMATAVVERHGGVVPTSMVELTSLPGVGRKTANVLRSVALGLPGLPVDTHVGRLARRLGLTTETDPVKVESELCKMLPAREWGAFSVRLILHGRAVCRARTPRCERCALVEYCPSGLLPIGSSRAAVSGVGGTQKKGGRRVAGG